MNSISIQPALWRAAEIKLRNAMLKAAPRENMAMRKGKPIKALLWPDGKPFSPACEKVLSCVTFENQPAKDIAQAACLSPEHTSNFLRKMRGIGLVLCVDAGDKNLWRLANAL